jgi:hypothetical protein
MLLAGRARLFKDIARTETIAENGERQKQSFSKK